MAGKYKDLLSTLRSILEQSGCTEQDFLSIAKEAGDAAIGVFAPLDVIIENGSQDNLADATDLMLIGAIVARYGMVMGNPFAGKE